MTRPLICALGFGALVSSLSLQAAEDPGIALPSVPRAVLLAANDAPAVIRDVSASSGDLIAETAREPSATALALGPKTTQVDGNAVYVATASEEPVSLFITEAGETATAISLTLAPRHIPPREVRLVLAGVTVPTAALQAKTPRPLVHKDQPYVEQIAAAFRALARDRRGDRAVRGRASR